MNEAETAERGRSPKVPLLVRLSPTQIAGLGELAAASTLPKAAVVRMLLDQGLAAQAGRSLTFAAGEARESDQALALAGLVATEQVLLLLEILVPDGYSRSAALRGPAADAAERRLQAMREQLSPGEAQ
jgi:hypothetical protein